MSIREIENNIISKLKDEFPEIHVEGFPDKPSEFILLHSIGALLVHYQGSNYSDSKAFGCVFQENKKEFSITVVTRNLRGNNGAYEYIDKIKQLLTGYQIDECSYLMPSKDNFISENGGIWQYAINFTLLTQNVQDY